MNRGPVRWHYESETDSWVARIGQLELLRVGDTFLRRCGEGRGLEETRTAARDGRVDFVAEMERGAIWIKRIIDPRCSKCSEPVGPMVARWMGAPAEGGTPGG